jgi:hypothetical protein
MLLVPYGGVTGADGPRVVDSSVGVTKRRYEK